MRDLVSRNSGELDRIRSGINQVFTDTIFRNWPTNNQGVFPPVDLYNTEGALVNLPGISIDDVEVTTNNDTLTISGEARLETGEGELLWQERSGGKF